MKSLWHRLAPGDKNEQRQAECKTFADLQTDSWDQRDANIFLKSEHAFQKNISGCYPLKGSVQNFCWSTDKLFWEQTKLKRDTKNVSKHVLHVLQGEKQVLRFWFFWFFFFSETLMTVTQRNLAGGQSSAMNYAFGFFICWIFRFFSQILKYFRILIF